MNVNGRSVARAHFANGNDVENVIIDGKIIVENRRIQTINSLEILKKTQEAGERTWSKFYN